MSEAHDRSSFGHRRATFLIHAPPTQFAGSFYGDYAGITVARGKAFPIWSDTRTPDAATWLGPEFGREQAGDVPFLNIVEAETTECLSRRAR